MTAISQPRDQPSDGFEAGTLYNQSDCVGGN